MGSAPIVVVVQHAAPESSLPGGKGCRQCSFAGVWGSGFMFCLGPPDPSKGRAGLSCPSLMSQHVSEHPVSYSETLVMGTQLKGWGVRSWMHRVIWLSQSSWFCTAQVHAAQSLSCCVLRHGRQAIVLCASPQPLVTIVVCLSKCRPLHTGCCPISKVPTLAYCCHCAQAANLDKTHIRPQYKLQLRACLLARKMWGQACQPAVLQLTSAYRSAYSTVRVGHKHIPTRLAV